MKLKEKLDFEIAVVVLPTMRFSIVLVSLLLWFRVSSAHDVRSFYCAQFYSGAAVQQTSKNMSLYLSGPLGTSDASTVKTIGQRFHRVVFVKNKNDMWVSRKDAVVNTLTAEGDIRLPIFLLGTKLAAQLGFEIREIGNEQIEILVPDAELLAEKIQKINASLKSRGLDPITYLPTRTGFVTVKETIQLILSAKGDYLVHFPYADLDQVIAPHEVSFHLGAILLSKKNYFPFTGLNRRDTKIN